MWNYYVPLTKLTISSSKGQKHGDDYLDQDGTRNQGTMGASSSENPTRGHTQTVGGTGGSAVAGSTTTGYPADTSAAANTTSGYNNPGNSTARNTTAAYPQGSTAPTNATSGYSSTGNTTASQAASGYPATSGYDNTTNTTSQASTGYPATSGYNTGNTTTSKAAAGYPASQGYSTTGSTAPVTSGAGYPSDTPGAGYGASGYSAAGNNTSAGNTSGYRTAANTAAQSGVTGGRTVDNAGHHLSKGPNEGTSISSGLGSAPNPGDGNEYYESGLTKGFQPTEAVGNVTSGSGAQTGSLAGRNNTSTGAGYQNTPSNATSGHHMGRDAAAVGTAGAAAEGSHLHHQNAKDNASSAASYDNSPSTQRTNYDIAASRTSGQGSHLHRQTGHENLGSDAGYNTTATSTDPSSGHHLGRDAAIVGGAGAAGAGAYHYRENEKDGAGSNAGYAGNTSSGASGAYAGPHGKAIPGPHATSAANLLDPAINTSGEGHIEDSHYHSRARGGGGEAADKFHNKKQVAGGVGTSSSTEK